LEEVELKSGSTVLRVYSWNTAVVVDVVVVACTVDAEIPGLLVDTLMLNADVAAAAIERNAVSAVHQAVEAAVACPKQKVVAGVASAVVVQRFQACDTWTSKSFSCH
jgi:hypothetical protein